MGYLEWEVIAMGDSKRRSFLGGAQESELDEGRARLLEELIDRVERAEPKDFEELKLAVEHLPHVGFYFQSQEVGLLRVLCENEKLNVTQKSELLTMLISEKGYLTWVLQPSPLPLDLDVLSYIRERDCAIVYKSLLRENSNLISGAFKSKKSKLALLQFLQKYLETQSATDKVVDAYKDIETCRGPAQFALTDDELSVLKKVAKNKIVSLLLDRESKVVKLSATNKVTIFLKDHRRFTWLPNRLRGTTKTMELALKAMRQRWNRSGSSGEKADQLKDDEAKKLNDEIDAERKKTVFKRR